MNRRKFIKRLGLSVGVVAVAPILLSAKSEPQPIVVEEAPFEGTDGLFAQIQNNPKEFTVHGDQQQIDKFHELLSDICDGEETIFSTKYRPLKSKSQIIIGDKIKYGYYK